MSINYHITELVKFIPYIRMVKKCNFNRGYSNAVRPFHFPIIDYETNEKICICQFEENMRQQNMDRCSFYSRMPKVANLIKSPLEILNLLIISQ